MRGINSFKIQTADVEIVNSVNRYKAEMSQPPKRADIKTLRRLLIDFQIEVKHIPKFKTRRAMYKWQKETLNNHLDSC
jgi:hypothetical protein